MVQALQGADDSHAAPGLYTIYDAYKWTFWKLWRLGGKKEPGPWKAGGVLSWLSPIWANSSRLYLVSLYRCSIACSSIAGVFILYAASSFSVVASPDALHRLP
ncbi:hypothetical protein DER46DRAFT_576991 [Fusarium sp. MPI-SDFR-AT-0072]|nr:hypothetical protein DER46DRAFT_576991 [Fusarium sp. MPI-SDFR-AT-0072]